MAEQDTGLQIGGVYILLYIRDTTLDKGFHWALYHHLAPPPVSADRETHTKETESEDGTAIVPNAMTASVHSHSGFGYKFNVRSIGLRENEHWISDSAPVASIMKAFLLAGAILIGFCPAERKGELSWIDHVDLASPPEGFPQFTCRTWTLSCIQRLVRQGTVVIRSGDEGCVSERTAVVEGVERLEAEAWTWGRQWHASANECVMPRPVVNAAVCVLGS